MFKVKYINPQKQIEWRTYNQPEYIVRGIAKGMEKQGFKWVMIIKEY